MFGPRERATSEGVGALGDVDLLSILIGTGAAGKPVSVLAAMLLERAGGIDGLARMGEGAIAEQKGLGPAKALRVVAAIELGKRCVARGARARLPLRTARDVVEHLAPTIATLDHEEMWVLALDGRNSLRGTRRVAQGGLHGCGVGPRDVLRAAIAEAASAFVLVHNHPSGDPTPSPEDVEMTKRLEAGAMFLGTPLVDHVIISSRDRWRSLLDEGVLAGVA